MLLDPERDCDFGVDALVTVCSWNPNDINDFGMDAPSNRMLLEPERNYDLAWMLW